MLLQCGLEPGDDGDVLTEKSGFPFYPPPDFFSAGTLALSPAKKVKNKMLTKKYYAHNSV
jgi:hypothetical protein